MISLFVKYKERLVQLPVNPQDISIKGDVNNKASDTVGQGEINDLGFSKLKELSISSFFPKRYNGELYINTGGNFKEPSYYIKLFEEIKTAREPFRLIITDIDINMLVSIEAFEYGYMYGTDDVAFQIDLKEFKHHNIRVLKPTATGYTKIDSTQKVATASITNTNSNRPIEKSIPKTYIVQEGDSLWKIAQKYLGDGGRWKEIYTYNNNKSIIGGNPSLIRPGQILSIPS